jgi:hypothetical protein
MRTPYRWTPSIHPLFMQSSVCIARIDGLRRIHKRRLCACDIVSDRETEAALLSAADPRSAVLVSNLLARRAVHESCQVKLRAVVAGVGLISGRPNARGSRDVMCRWNPFGYSI